MIKLKETFVKESPVAYHVAETDEQDSIETHGLDPMKYQSGEITTGGKYIFVFLDYNEAEGYISGYNDFLRMQSEPERYFDIWKINTKGLELIKDLDLNTGEDPMKDSAYFTEAPIDKKRLKLKSTERR